MSYRLPCYKATFAFFFFITVNAGAQPTITSFTPATSPIGTSITITGTNFNAVPASNIVYFGAVEATVTTGTTTSLTVTAPAGATYEPISVLDNVTGLTAYSSKPFITTFTNPFGTGIPAGFYGPKVDFVAGTNPRNVATGDVDGDGKPELLVSNGNSNNISVYHNISTPGNITASSFDPKVDFATGNAPDYVVISDVDGDGKPDLVFAQSGSIAVRRNTSTAGSISAASFAAQINFIPLFNGAAFVAMSDVDGDGRPELVSANPSANTISVLRNTSTPGSISFAAKVDPPVGLTPSSVAIGDVDGDGKPDFVVTNSAPAVNTVSVLRNTSTPGSISLASFAPKVTFTTGDIPRSVAIGDVDGDGKPDLVVANNLTSPAASTVVSVLRNTATPGSIDATSFAAKVDFTAGTAPRYVSIGDVDGDGKPDLVVANLNSDNISVLRNTSTSGSIDASSFAATVDFTTLSGPVSVAIVDVDGDGIPEIAAANGSASFVSVFQIDLSIVPVTLTNVKAYQKSAGVQIEWTTQQEINIEKYEVEKSQNGQQFVQLGSVQAKGNSSVVINYNLVDPNPFSGINFYRIKIVDKSGLVTHSQVLKVNTFKGVASIAIYPNPVIGNTIVLQVNNLQKGSYAITLTNKTGQQVFRKMMEHAGGSASEPIEPLKALAAGAYQLRLTGGGINIVRQVIKN